MISVRELKKSYDREHQVLRGINLEVKKGEIVAMIGGSGAGKTTLLRCLNYLETPESGTIRIDDAFIDAQKPTRKHIRALRSKSAMVFQHFNLFNNKTVLENVTEALITVKKVPKKSSEDRGRELLEQVGMLDKAAVYPSFLSGGQKQRVGIARALATEPEVILFDEPTSALDPEWVAEVLGVMQKIAARGITMLVVSHEMRFVRSLATRIVFLSEGRILEDGTPEQIFRNPRYERTSQFLRLADLSLESAAL
ncbi:MAG: amino acid ABC transporter ATP-binding protein [Succinivibrio sp.]|nr:amino acid ABC transporter ATP-binding protein [Succinivibrio sp.]